MRADAGLAGASNTGDGSMHPTVCSDPAVLAAVGGLAGAR
jgi:hypothetical protein